MISSYSPHRPDYPVSLALALASALLFAACGDETGTTPEPEPDGSEDIGPADSAADTPSEGADQSTETAPLDGSLEGSDQAVEQAWDQAASEPGEDAKAPVFALFVGSDYGTQAELAAVQLPATLVGHHTSADQDTIVTASGRHAFLLQRTDGKAAVLSDTDPSVVSAELDFGLLPDAGGANPYALVVAAGTKAYGMLYDRNAIPVFDLGTHAQTGSVDLSGYVADPDGFVDAFDGLFDPASGRVYIGLQRIDRNEFGTPPDFAAPCLGAPALLVAIDSATDELVDLNGAADGAALELKTADPAALNWDDAHQRIIVLGVGCADPASEAGTGRIGRGVEAVDPATGTSSWLWQTEQLDRPASLIWVSDHEAYVGLDDASFTRKWFSWDPQTATLQSELAGVPLLPVYDGDGGLIGLQMGQDAGEGVQLVRLDLALRTSTVLLGSVFNAAGLNPYSSAILR